MILLLTRSVLCIPARLRSFASCNHDISASLHVHAPLHPCNRDISASLHVYAPLHPATAILVHPCTSTLLCILQPRY